MHCQVEVDPALRQLNQHNRVFRSKIAERLSIFTYHSLNDGNKCVIAR